jgi:hypothetical protein
MENRLEGARRPANGARNFEKYLKKAAVPKILERSPIFICSGV